MLYTFLGNWSRESFRKNSPGPLASAQGKVRSIKTDLVFHTQNHTAIDECNVGRAFRIVQKKADIKDFRFHDLRHTFATRMVQTGKDLYKVQVLLVPCNAYKFG